MGTNQFKVMDAYGNIEAGKCWATWVANNTACGQCVISKDCCEATQRTATEKQATMELGDGGKKNGTPPLEYALNLLKGKYDYKVLENETATAHCFSTDGKIIVKVLVSKKTGRIKLENGRTSKVFKGFDSIEHAEDAIRGITE